MIMVIYTLISLILVVALFKMAPKFSMTLVIGTIVVSLGLFFSTLERKAHSSVDWSIVKTRKPVVDINITEKELQEIIKKKGKIPFDTTI